MDSLENKARRRRLLKELNQLELESEEQSESFRQAYREQGKFQERERIIKIIEQRRDYDCRCKCDCHAEPAPCIACQADNELIEIIKGEQA